MFTAVNGMPVAFVGKCKVVLKVLEEEQKLGDLEVLGDGG